MNRLIFALALTPVLLAGSAKAQTVSDDVTKELWCGTAFTIAFAQLPSDAPSEQQAEAQHYIDGGQKLIDAATQAHLDAGFTEEQVTKIKADLVAELTPIVSNGGDPSKAKYSFDECVALVDGTAPGAAPSATPDASAASSASQ